MKIIIVDDSKEFMTLVRRQLAKAMPDVEVTEYDPEQQGHPGHDFDWGIYDVALFDYHLGSDETAFDWLTRYRSAIGFPPVILMTAEGDEYVAAKGIKLGASDFIRKADITSPRLSTMVQDVWVEHTPRRPDLDQTINRKLQNDAQIFHRFQQPVDPSTRRPPTVNASVTALFA
ncbi:MAG: response regulator [Gammaproteobacteria bacterium]|nr:response regulator [Gammaproteobacteria bacterium]